MRKFASLFTMLMLLSALAFGQTRTVTGQVRDDKGDPIPFATVTETGTSNATKADASGYFSIKVREGASLTVTAAGHEAATVSNPVGNIAVTLRIVSVEGREVVVTTALGIKKRPKEIGYANTTVRSEQIVNGRSPNLAAALSGKVAGLTIQNTSNSVNAAPRITLRGNRSITQTNTAMVVLDGVPVSASVINTLNPNDIESVTTLKGGQAATLYGSDGVNGVLVINTKRGSGRPSVSFTSTANFEQVAYLPDFQDTHGSGSHYGSTPQENYRPFENQQYGDAYDGSIRAVGRVLEDGSYLELPYKNIPGVRNDLFETGFSTQNDVAVSGGDATSTYYLSFQDYNSEGIVWKDKYRRDVLRFSAGKIYGKFRATLDASYVVDRAQRTTTDFYFYAVNTATWIPIGEMKDWKNYKFAHPNAYFNDYYNNPWFELDNNRNDNRNNRFIGNLTLNLKPANWVNLTYRVGTNVTNNFQKSWQNRFNFSNWAKNLAPTRDPQYNDYYGIFRARNDIQGGVADFTSVGSRVNSDFLAEFNKDFGNISARAVVGNSISATFEKVTGVGSTSVIIPDLFNTGNRSGDLVGRLGDGRAEENSRVRKVGNFLQLGAGYKDYFFLNGSFRYDISSVFYRDGRERNLYSYPYFGGDASLILTDAFPSIKSDAFSFMKLRVSWNKNGNDNLGPYRLDPVFLTGAGFPYGSTVGTTVGNEIPAADLKPEFVYTTEAGFEATFWKDRINLDVTGYKQTSSNQIIPVQISSSTGATQTLLNAAKIENRGIEAELRARAVRNRNWTIDLFGNYTLNENEVEELFVGIPRIQINSNGRVAFVNAQVGNPFPFLRGIAWMRSPEGKLVIDPNDGWPVLDTVQHDLGRTIPKHSVGLGFRVNYRLWTLAANAEFRGGHVVYHDVGEDLGFTGSGAITTIYNREQFIFPNSVYWDGTKYVDNVNIPVANDLAIYGAWGDYSFSRGILAVAEVFTTSANFWKLRDVSLTFDFPKPWLGSGRIVKGASLSAFGRNLVTLLPRENIYTDPEFASTNGNGVGINTSLNTPPVRQFGATLNVIF
ncbi:MAG TPA: SusC/RagA family TonB-linked outer membrane protein [Chitinophagaceae bacterium]|nr:SusC/RagA family TonB-linked outer membrane protein [Chitinophagaceae bacterium]